MEYPIVDQPLQDFEVYLTDHPRRPIAAGPGKREPRFVVREVEGSWHYPVATTHRRFWFSLVFAASSIAAGLLGFNGHPSRKVVTLDGAPSLTLIELPKILPDDEDEPTDTHAPDNNAAVDVPALPDVPATVTLENSFVQQIDYTSLQPHTNVDASNLRAIPAMIRHSGAASALRGLKEIFNLSDLDHVPEPVFQPMPRVTEQMLEGGTQGQVLVEFIVTQTGDVLDPQIVKAEPYRVGDATLAAVAKWRFHPGIKNGKRVNTRVRQPIVIRPVTE